MLTDIFAYRYEQTPIWQTFGEAERRLLIQAFQIVREQLFPTENLANKAKWTPLHDKLCRELGLEELSPKNWSHWSKLPGGQDYWSTVEYSMDEVCKNFVCAEYDGSIPADRFMKERISFVELAFREREEELKEIHANLGYNPYRNPFDDVTGSKLGAFITDKRTKRLMAANQALNDAFKASVEELNERFRRAGCKLHYHNGFIQQSSDELTKQQVEEPFWALLTDPIWKNVDYDMKDAIDKRDGGDRDPAFYAAKALESTIKIISDKMNWTIGKERGASNYIENLYRGNLIKDWEMDALKHFFNKVRNPMGHGAGSAEMPELSPSQTDWAIEFCMSWIKNLIRGA